MNRRIRMLAVLLAACFLLLFLQLNNLQVRQATALQNSKYQQESNSVDPFEQPRGEIISADGDVLAKSTATNDGYGELRSYPYGSLFADITGYYDVTGSAAPLGIEAEYNDELGYHSATASNLRELLTSQSGTDSVVLTVSEKLQNVAREALQEGCSGEAGGCQLGAVVAIDPQNGDVLAMYGTPTYDPNLLSSGDAKAVAAEYERLADPPSSAPGGGGQAFSPLINFATGQLIAPGSTMKVITTAAIYDHDPALATETWPDESRISLPDTTSTLQNFDGEVCGGSLVSIIEISCDTAYAEIGLSLGGSSLVDEAQSFGFGSRPPLDLPSSEVQAAQISSAATLNNTQDKPFLAYSAIGQYDVQESALTDALVAAGIGDGGTIMAPHLMQDIVSQDGTVVDSYKPHVWKTATSHSTSASVKALMVDVANHGTAAGVFTPLTDVAAKTGTAETGSVGCSANWMTATAPAGPNDTSTIAVAAVIPYQTGLSCGDTGATVAGPVVAKVLKAALAMQSSGQGTS